MDLKAVGWDARNWMDLAQDRDQWRAYVRAVMNLRISPNPIVWFMETTSVDKLSYRKYIYINNVCSICICM